MDKDQKPIVDFMIEKSYRIAIENIIAIKIMNELSNMRSSIKVLDDGREPTAEFLDMVFLSLLQQDNAKKVMIQFVSDLRRMKTDYLAELMTQYNLHKDNEATYIHYRLCAIFDKSIEKFKQMIHKGDFKRIYAGRNF